MPLTDLSADQAVETRKANPFASWEDRSKANRIEPVAKPSFKAPLRLENGETIFTVGSCFARNVELELMRHGFQVPMRNLLKRPEFLHLEAGAVNNFGTPSIFNELAWALGERPFVPEDHIVELVPGRYADLHIISSIKAESWDIVVARRHAIAEAFRTVRDCRVVIMTLGLVEVWFDTKTGYYLNAPPRPTLIRREPDRFRLHVLSYEEVYHYLAESLRLIRSHGRPDVHVIISVSPVPLMATHRDQDVMVANAYSKSVLRTAAETAVCRHDFVSYFPSFESVTLSDRKIAWRDDMVHVTDTIVAMNVGRLIEACVDSAGSATDFRRDIEIGGAVAAVDWAQKVRRGPQVIAQNFFAEFGDLGRTSVDFAIEHAGFLIGLKDYEGALAVLDQVPTGKQDVRIDVLTADVIVKLGRAREAYDLLEPLATRTQRLFGVWDGLLNAAKALDDLDLVAELTERWCEAAPGRAGRIRALTGRWFLKRRDYVTAMKFLAEAVRLVPEDASARLFYAEALEALGRVGDAREQAALIQPMTPSQMALTSRLDRRLGLERALL